MFVSRERFLRFLWGTGSVFLTSCCVCLLLLWYLITLFPGNNKEAFFFLIALNSASALAVFTHINLCVKPSFPLSHHPPLPCDRAPGPVLGPTDREGGGEVNAKQEMEGRRRRRRGRELTLSSGLEKRTPHPSRRSSISPRRCRPGSV